MTPRTLATRAPDALVLPQSAVLVTIDLQRGFDGFSGRNNPDCEANAAAVQAAWRRTGRNQLHVRHDSVELRSVFRPGQPGNAFKAETAPRANEAIVSKSVHSAFIGTDLDLRLRRLGCDTVVLQGIQTNFCVASTARMAGNLGFRTFVVGDACATFPQALLDGRIMEAALLHDVALAELHGEFATVTTAQEVLRAVSTQAASRGARQRVETASDARSRAPANSRRKGV